MTSGVVADSGRSMRSVAVVGDLAPGTQRQVGAAEWWFTLQEHSEVLRVHYRGVVPSTFADGARVLLVGRMSGDTFIAKRVAVRTRL
jgi:cytochrome c-type biogenesis protein CcmE